MRALLARFRDLCRRRTLLATLEEEMRFHRDALEAEYRRSGYSAEAARRAAARDLGDPGRVREDLRAQAGWPAAEELLRDLHLAVRGLMRRPTFSLGVAAVLGLGMAAAMTLLVLIDGAFLRPLPVPAAEELRVAREADGSVGLFTGPTLRRLTQAVPASVRLAVHSAPNRVTVQRGRAPAERAEAQLVGGDFFRALGIAPLAGRLLGPQDDRPGDPEAVAVVAAAWARERFGTAEAALGAELQINRQPVTIVGVLPPDFRGVVVGGRTHLWMPTGLQSRLGWSGNAWVLTSDDRPNDPDWNREERVSWLHLIVRIPEEDPAPLLPLLAAAARPALEEWGRQIDDPRQREAMLRRSWSLAPARTGYAYFRSSFGGTGRLLGGIIGALLLLTVANVSNLLLVRTLNRHREFGVRLALGSGRWRVSRLGLIEALVLSSLGAVGALLLATWLVPVGAALLLPGQELPLEVIAWRPLAALVVLTVLTGSLCAWAPAAWIARLDPLVALAGRTSAVRSPQRLGRALVIGQIAVAVVLVTVSVGLARDLQRTLTADPGFATRQVLTSTFDPSSAGYDGDRAVTLYQRIEDRLHALPGVEAVGWARNGVLAGSRNRSTIFARGSGASSGQQYQSDHVVPAYFTALGFRLLQGRLLSPADRHGPPVAVVTQAFAEAVFPGTEVIGRQFGYGATPSTDDFTIVGVVSDVQVNAMDEPPPPMFFVPWQEEGAPLRFLAVRTSGDPALLVREMRAELEAIDPAIVWSPWLTLQERIEHDLRGRLSTSHLALSLAAAALLLASIGAGVSLAHLVVLRRRELAVRMALGADHRAIVCGVLGDAWRTGAWGAVIGLVLLAVLQVLPAGRQLLAGSWDLPALAAAVVAGLVATTAGAWRPAMNAIRIEPQRLLTNE